ncbi:hypothetical protein RHGRI_037082 [Rhododendron griersonianum]|uniref:40S ribosomal protein S6 n=1 Tax=Rhododendron griersonianum TaxID=479676 RepID=A0AAV6HW68_9ERIC|nr:hypothetical protein RHGRI_037082 [Rhododendron griersonianum]
MVLLQNSGILLPKYESLLRKQHTAAYIGLLDTLLPWIRKAQWREEEKSLCVVALSAPNKARKKISKAPKIQRLVTPLTLQRRRAKIAEKKRRIAKAKTEAAEYQKLLASRLKEQREKRSESLAKKRSRLAAASKPSIVA